MIKQIQIKKVATITDQALNPKKINFIYGGNGTGKTTISKIIKGNIDKSNAIISWDNENPLDVFAYNSDFVKHNFSEESTIPGIFTLGIESIETQKYIEDQKIEMSNIQLDITGYVKREKDLSTELDKNKATLTDVCWEFKRIYSDKFTNIFKSYTKSKNVFTEKCLSEFKKRENGTSQIKTIEKIEELYNLAFNDNLTIVNTFTSLNIEEIKVLENFSLLKKEVKGSSDTDIGKFIEYLNISDWVKQGTIFADKTEGKCPYCQRTLPVNVKNEIKNYFDKSYEDDCSKLKNFKEKYISFFSELFIEIESITNSNIEILDFKELKNIYNESFLTFNQNKILLQNKIDSPSKIIKLFTLIPFFDDINKFLLDFNKVINKNNDAIENKKNKQELCKQYFWFFIINQMEGPIQKYIKTDNGINTGLSNLQDNKTKANTKIELINKNINEKEETLTSVKPTVKAINAILESFGFNGFLISENTESKGTYYIKRPNGTPVNDTLSEGEYNFITFIYFYHLIHGSKISTNTNTDRVIVIDDPVSSLDSNSLFIISTLIRNIKEDCMHNINGIKQVFIFTHNVYFHKEVTFARSKSQQNPKNIAYWILKKKEEETSIEISDKNKIFTSYDLLWEVLRDKNSSNISIFNTMRRILEYYFNLLGGMDYEKCIDEFKGKEKIIFKSLISCINEESHLIVDDFSMYFDEDNIDKYLTVFKKIFENLHQENHYTMMMKKNDGIAI